MEVKYSNTGCMLLLNEKNKSYMTILHFCSALDDFNNGVVLTSRYLRPEELFEVRIDRMIDKWAGSIEIGVTLHPPHELDFPSTMTNIRSGTWMMTGNGVMHNGTTIIDEYGQNLDRLKVNISCFLGFFLYLVYLLFVKFKD